MHFSNRQVSREMQNDQEIVASAQKQVTWQASVLLRAQEAQLSRADEMAVKSVLLQYFI